jgi:hypothetical protein
MRRLLVIVLALGLVIGAAGCAKYWSHPPGATSPADTYDWLPSANPDYFPDVDNTAWPRGYMGGP